MAVWILGGGVPKNYTLQGEPLLDQILGVPTHGFDIDVQFCVDPVDNGALSSCPAGEGHTWGKVSAESVADRERLRARRRDRGLPVAHVRAPQRPEDEAQAAPPLRRARSRGGALQREVEKRRQELAPTLSYPLADGPPGKGSRSRKKA